MTPWQWFQAIVKGVSVWRHFRPFRKLRNRRRAKKGLPPLEDKEISMEFPNWAKEFVSMFVRHGLSWAGGALSTLGITVTDSMIQSVTGGVLIVAGYVWSWYRKRKDRPAVA